MMMFGCKAIPRPELLLLAFLVLFVSLDVPAQDQTTNGCGSGWTQYVVPNDIPKACVAFREACNTHDICYGQCMGVLDPERLENRDNPKQGSYDTSSGERRDVECRLDNRDQRRATCDALLLADLRSACIANARACNKVANTVCERVASLYGFAVRLGGGWVFRGPEPKEDEFHGPVFFTAFAGAQTASVPAIDQQALQADLGQLVGWAQLEKSQPVTAALVNGVPILIFGWTGDSPPTSADGRLIFAKHFDLTDARIVLPGWERMQPPERIEKLAAGLGRPVGDFSVTGEP